MLLLQAPTKQPTKQQNTHTRSKAETDDRQSQHGTPGTTVSADPHLPKEDKRNRNNSQVPELCHTQTEPFLHIFDVSFNATHSNAKKQY